MPAAAPPLCGCPKAAVLAITLHTCFSGCKAEKPQCKQTTNGRPAYKDRCDDHSKAAPQPRSITRLSKGFCRHAGPSVRKQGHMRANQPHGVLQATILNNPSGRHHLFGRPSHVSQETDGCPSSSRRYPGFSDSIRTPSLRHSQSVRPGESAPPRHRTRNTRPTSAALSSFSPPQTEHAGLGGLLPLVTCPQGCGSPCRLRWMESRLIQLW